MKSKEEILKGIIGSVRDAIRDHVFYDDAISAMQSYADQETELGKSMYSAAIGLIAEHRDQIKQMQSESHQLRSENERLKRKIDNMERMRITGSRI